MTDDAETATPAERMPFAWLPSFARLRAVLLVLALLGFWGVMAYSWFARADSGEYEPLFDAARIAITVGLVLLTALWIASIRYVRLRDALLPIEAGIVVGVAIAAIGSRGVEVDTTEDAVFLAGMVGIGTTIVVGVLSRLVEGRRSAPLWIGSVMLAAVFLGAGLPAIADQLSDEGDVWYDGVVASPVMSKITSDGAVVLSDSYRATTGVNGSYDVYSGFDEPLGVVGGPEGPEGTYDGSVPVPVPVDPALDAPGIPSSLSNAIRILLKARADKPMELEISSAATTDDIPIELAVRRGSCSEPTGRDIERWTSTSPSKPFTRKLRGIDIGTVETLHLVMGTAQPLAPVRCVDLAGPLGVQLAQNGALEFGRDCIAPLQLGSSTRVALTPESLQDQRCAAALEQLTSIVSGAVVAADQVTEAETCFSNIGVEARIEQLHDGSASVQLPDSLSPDDYDEAMRCLGIDPAPVGYAEATPADTDPSGENIR